MNTDTEIDKLIAEYTASKLLAKETPKQQIVLPENAKLVDHLRCPTCQLAYFVDHPTPVIDEWVWSKESRVVRFAPAGKTKTRQDCDRKFAYFAPKPTAVRDTSGNINIC